MYISVIIPTCNEGANSSGALDSLAKQAGDYEIVVVDSVSTEKIPTPGQDRARVVSAPDTAEGVQLKTGAEVARGEVLLFLDLHSRLPPDALLAIERNLKLLPQTIGGNFHLKFETRSLFTRLLARLLKWWRYRGSYCGNSGIFIRKSVYEEIGGFHSGGSLTDYDLAWRMEKYGPTLYLPEAIVAPAPSLREALAWVLAPIFMRSKHHGTGTTL